MTERERLDLKPCPFCGGSKILIHRRDVEPQQDPWYGQKNELIVECDDCAATLFNKYFHDGFYNESDAVSAWNKRA
jgi:Lar family restriction alleviation protein